MPVDLDEMFSTLGRQADAIPLAPAAQARRRGRQRTRTRAMFSAAVAVGSLVADEGRLFYEEGVAGSYRIQAVDLRAGGGPSVILGMAPGRRAVALTPCGTDRLCVVDGDSAGGTAVTAIDVASRRQLWRVAGPEGGGTLEAVGGRTVVVGAETAVYDQNGAEVFRTSTATVQLDADSLLALPLDPADPVSKGTFADGRTTRLGEIPAVTGPCLRTTDRLACPTATRLRIWSLSG